SSVMTATWRKIVDHAGNSVGMRRSTYAVAAPTERLICSNACSRCDRPGDSIGVESAASRLKVLRFGGLWSASARRVVIEASIFLPGGTSKRCGGMIGGSESPTNSIKIAVKKK